MAIRTLKIDYSEWLLDELEMTPEQFETEMRLVLAAHLCKREALSTGAAAVFAGISKPEFLQRMGEFGVPAFGLRAEELENDARTALGDQARLADGISPLYPAHAPPSSAAPDVAGCAGCARRSRPEMPGVFQVLQ